MSAPPPMRHRWGPHEYGRSWSKCEFCGASRLYDSMPGWPGWYVYFNARGDKVESEGECRSDGPLFDRAARGLPP